LKKETKDKIKRGLKKIGDFAEGFEKTQDLQNEIKGLAQARSPSEMSNRIKRIKEISEDISKTKEDNLKYSSKMEEHFDSLLDYGKQYSKSIKINKERKGIKPKDIKLPKLDKKHISQFKKLEKSVDIIGCLICGYKNYHPNAKFCKKCGQKLLIYNQKGDYHAVLNSCKTAIKNDLEDNYTWIDMASIYYSKGKYGKAIKAYKKILENIPAEPIIHVYLGLAYMKLSKYNKAKKAFKNGLEINPNNDTILSFLGLARVLDGKQEKGLKDCIKAVELKPKDKIAWNNLSRIYNNINQFDEAIDAAQKSIDLDLTFAHPLNNLGYAYHNMGLIDDAAQAYLRALDKDQYYNEAWRNLGLLYHDMGEYKHASNAYWDSIKLEPQDHLTWYNLAMLFYNQQNFDKALQANKICLDCNPKFNEALVFHEVILGSDKKFQKDYKVWFKLAKLLYKNKQFEKSLDINKKCLEINQEYKDATKLEEKIKQSIIKKT